MAEVLTYPDNIVPDSIDWRIMYNTQVFTSPFGNTTQTAEIPGARWQARMNYSNLQQTELRELAAFFIQLRGMSGRFKLYDLGLPYPQQANGVAASIGATTVVSATRSSVTLTAGRAALLTVGDYLEVTPLPSGNNYVNSGPELKMVTGINGDTVNIEPPFRIIPSDTETVTFDKCQTRFMLDSDDQAGWSTAGSIYLSNFSVSCVEIF